MCQQLQQSQYLLWKVGTVSAKGVLVAKVNPTVTLWYAVMFKTTGVPTVSATAESVAVSASQNRKGIATFEFNIEPSLAALQRS
jgi:hypothetical protein